MLKSFVKTSSCLFQQIRLWDIRAILQPQGYRLHRLQPQHILFFWHYVFFPNEIIPNKIFPNCFSLTTFFPNSTQSARFSLIVIFPNNGPHSSGGGGGSPLINTQVPEEVTLQGSGGGSPLLVHNHNFVRLSKVG